MLGDTSGGRKRVGRLLPLLAILILAAVAGGGLWFGTGGRLFGAPTPATIYVLEVTPSASAAVSDSAAPAGSSDFPSDLPSDAPTDGPTASADASAMTPSPGSTATRPPATPATTPTPTPVGPVHWFTPTPAPPTPTATPTHAPTATPHMPNLAVGSVHLPATTVRCGTAFRVQARVTNTGPVTSSPVHWRVGDYYGSWHYGLGGGDVPALAPHDGIEVDAYSVLINYGCGATHVLMIQVDFDGRLTEGNESDNQSHISYTLDVAS